MDLFYKLLLYGICAMNPSQIWSVENVLHDHSAFWAFGGFLGPVEVIGHLGLIV